MACQTAIVWAAKAVIAVRTRLYVLWLLRRGEPPHCLHGPVRCCAGASRRTHGRRSIIILKLRCAQDPGVGVLLKAGFVAALAPAGVPEPLRASG